MSALLVDKIKGSPFTVLSLLSSLSINLNYAATAPKIRIYGEEFNVALRRHVLRSLEEARHAAVAPMLTPNWTIVKSERFSYDSSWSERHAGHAAGLGTFGLCDGLITAKGKAMRVGSVIAKISINPTPRPYPNHQAYCLFFADGTWSPPENMSKQPISLRNMDVVCVK